MPDVSQNVIIDFQLQNQQLAATVDLLQKTNDISEESVGIYNKVNSAIAQNTQLVDSATDSVSAHQEVYDKLAHSLITLSGQSKKTTQDLLTLSPDQVAKGFEELGISVDDYIDILQKAGQQQTNVAKSGNTLRTQLQQTRNAMAELVAIQTSGNKLTQEQQVQFDELALKAGKLSNALQQTNKVTKNLASDAPLINSFAEGVNGLAGAFQAAVGAEALFGADNKDLQETLVKVTSVTAIAQGIQQSLNLVRKEGALATAAVVIQERLAAAQLAITNGLESESVIVRTAATVAQKALNLAMKANPILLIVTALIAFVAAIYEYTQITGRAAAETREFDNVIQEITVDLEAYNNGLTDATDKQNAFLKDAGAAQSTILANTGSNIARLIQGNLDAQRTAGVELDKLNKEIEEKGGEERVKRAKELGTQLLKLSGDLQKLETEQTKNGLETRRAATEESLQKIIDLNQAAVANANPAGTGQFAAQRSLVNAQASLQLEQARGNSEKILAINAQLQQKIRDINLANAQFIADNRLAIDNRALVKAQEQSRAINDRTSQEEIDAQNKFDKDQLARTLLNLKLTSQERQDETDKTNQKIADRNRDFAKQQLVIANQDDDSRQKAELANIQKDLTEQLGFRIQSLEDEAQIEILANQGKSEKIKEINAKLQNDILAAKKAAIDEATAHELNAFNTLHADELRAIEKQLSNQATIQSNDEGLGGSTRAANRLGTTVQTPDQQKALIEQETKIQQDAIDIQIEGLKKKQELTGQLDSTELLQFNSLQDQKTQILEASLAKQDAIDEAARKKRRQRTIDEVNLSVQAVSQGLGIIASYYQQQDDAANQRLANDKQRIQDELDAGNISAKEAKRRNDALDVQQKKLQYEQAKRQKALALFQAIINTALAITNAIVTGDPYTAALRAAIAAAIGGTEIAVIASKPLPQFDKGKKKGLFEGFGKVAERKPELVEQDGRMFLVNKPTTLWLGRDDVVYNPKQTTDMLENMTFGKNLMVGSQDTRANNLLIDYDRFGKTVADNIPQHGFDLTENGLQEWVKKGNSTTRYLNRRRRFKK